MPGRKRLDWRRLTVLTKARYSQSELAAVKREAEGYYSRRGHRRMVVEAVEVGDDLCLFLRKQN